MITDTEQGDPSVEANRIIEIAKQGCVDRGEGKGKCHVFLDHSNVCECGEVDLTKHQLK